MLFIHFPAVWKTCSQQNDTNEYHSFFRFFLKINFKYPNMVTIDNIKDKIRKYVMETTYASPELVKDDSLIFSDGIFDSMGFVLLINFIEETFHFKAEDNELLEDNFESINAMANAPTPTRTPDRRVTAAIQRKAAGGPRPPDPPLESCGVTSPPRRRRPSTVPRRRARRS
jgi:acyl carrier protein